MKKLRRQEDRGNDSRLLAFRDAQKDIDEFEARQVKADRFREERRKRDQGYAGKHYKEKGIGWCSVEGCDNVDLPTGHHRCTKHTYHYYYPYFVLGMRDYVSRPEIAEAA